jgi:two-component system OmpR family response regulator
VNEQRRRIVIADDDDDIRGLMQIAAERAGVDVVAADNGRSALDAVLAGGVDLAVLDISMPGLNGIEVAQAIRADERARKTLILMISASVQLLTDHGEVSDLSDGFIVKPFSPRVLTARIREMLSLEATA